MRPTIGAQPTGAQVVGAACRSVVGASAAGRYRRSVRAIRRFTVRPVLPEPLLALGELAINLRWSWHVGTQELFKAVDPVRWEASGHDPIRLLGALEPDRLTTLSGDRRFLRQLAAASEDLHEYLSGPRWYQGLGDDVPARIAYFSPEFGIAAVLPQYSGGLGILAGDHLKTASDLGVPLVGVGLLYRHGYFRQDLSREGWQQERYPLADPDGLPLTLLRESDDTPVRIEVGLPEGHRLYARVWLASVGRVPLLMLDSDVEENTGLERDVTDRLYGGTTEHRLLQELLLGIGGVRALRAYARVSGAPSPEVFHTNEGHAGFLGLERIRELVDEGGLDFDAALEVTRAGTVFTTHTPVPAGIDRFPAELIEQHFGGDTGSAAVPVERILALGAENYEGGEAGVFNMAVMGMRLAQRANGVSQLHRSVSREMFRGLWPGFDTDDVPIGSVTNGVHAPTWVAPELAELARRETSVELVEDDQDWERLDALPASAVWDVKRRLRLRLVTDTRARLRRSWLYRGASPAELAWVDGVLDPRRADHRVRPSRRVVQAADVDDARPRPAGTAAAASRTAHPAGDRRQGAPERRDRQAADPGGRALRRRPSGAPPDRVPAQLRHRHGADPLPRVRRVAQQPAPPVRGVRHVGHEGRAQRRPERLGARRLVGRVARPRLRLVDPVRRRDRGHRPA
jgi:starch phosphorylase